MHRDLKPENIFLVSKFNDTNVRIGDFGSAAFFSEGLNNPSTSFFLLLD
jgi:serine/threonine protein kinase